MFRACCYLSLGLLVFLNHVTTVSTSQSSAQNSQVSENGKTIADDSLAHPDNKDGKDCLEKSDGHGDPENLDVEANPHGHGDGRYQVFRFDFVTVQGPYIVSIWIFVASIAKIGFHLQNKLSSIFPESCLLIILGIIAGIIVYFSIGGPEAEDNDALKHQYTLNAATFFQFLLPPIILDAGYFMPNRAFFNNIGTILLYAVVGTLWNTASIGLTLYGLSVWMGTGIKPLHCLVFSSLISAVDPVAVLAVFEEIHVNEQLHIVVFGESLLNDAVTVVLYHMFMEYAAQDEVQTLDIFAGVLQFFIVGIGGVLIGVLFGLACAFITKFTSHVRVIEPIFVFLLAYLSYLTAEMFHLSGIMALTFCGIVMKQYVIFNISEKSQTTIKYFLKMLSSMTETVIFMLLGTSTIKDDHSWDLIFFLVTILSCLIYRAIGTLGLTWLANKKRVSKLTFVDQFVMAYGGLRGAIAFALAILLDENVFRQKDLFVTATILVVMFTVFVQGITIKPLVNWLNVRKRHQGPGTMNEQIHERLLDHTMAAIEDITGYHGNHWLRDKWEYYDNEYLRKYLLREKQKTKEHGIMRVHSKLSLKDAMQSVHTGFSSHQLGPNSGKSLLQLIKNHSFSSIQDHEDHDIFHPPRMSSHGGSENDLHNNSTVVDMQALEAHYSKKIADDTKTHHMLEENLITARPRWTAKHQRHTLNDDYHTNKNSYLHHSMRLNLRQMISKHQHYLQEKRKQRAEKRAESKLHKNVSFARFSEPSATLDVHKPENTSSIYEASDDEGGIEFTAKTHDTDEPDNVDPPLSPVALECELPWKRTVCSQESNPIPSRVNHLLPDDNKPSLAQVPSWANNLDYNNIPAMSPRSDSDTLNPISSQSEGYEDSDISPNISPRYPTTNSASHEDSQASDPELEPIGRALPSIPLIQIYNAEKNGDGGYKAADRLLQPVPRANGQSSTTESHSSTSSPDIATDMLPPIDIDSASSATDGANPSNSANGIFINIGDDSSEDDEEVEIKPFGKIDLTNRSGSPVLQHENSENSLDTPAKSGVLFSITGEDSSGSSES